LSKKNLIKSIKRIPKTALITGINGQDGSYLAELLLRKKYKVFGLVKNKKENLKYVPKGAVILYGDLGDIKSLKSAVSKSKPDEVYNLAGISDLKTAFQFPKETMKINFKSVRWLLVECLKVNPKVRFLQASSSEIFRQSSKPLNEQSVRNLRTDNPYAKAKMEADEYLKNQRENKNIFACSAILFNHESPRRPDRFVTRKITLTLAKIKLGLAKCLELGNLDAERDWGFAGDYVEAMHKILQAKKPEDFTIATGKTHTVKEFVKAACELLSIKISWRGKGIDARGLNSKGKVIVRVNPDFYRPVEKYIKVGDITKAKKVLKWKPKTSFQQLVNMMVQADTKNISKK
jgi:GDPmannose 4,6-dehydratase